MLIMIWWLLWGENINDKASAEPRCMGAARCQYELRGPAWVFAAWPLLGLFSPLFLEEQLRSEVRGARNRRAAPPGQRLGATLAD